MLLNEKKPKLGQSNVMDRLSDLPDYILHHVISSLGSEASCRTTILSKRWRHVWSTRLILDFTSDFFIDRYLDRRLTDPDDKETIEKLINLVETTMQRYSEQRLSIRKFDLLYPTSDPEMAVRVDRWLGIAVQNQVEALTLYIAPSDPTSYALPEVLFSAKSLISMDCSKVRLPFCHPLKLISLQSLEFSEACIDEHMLQHIIQSCPLKKLTLSKCTGLEKNLVIQSSSLERLHVSPSIPIGGTIVVDTPSLQYFSYHCNREIESWPFILKPATKKNLRALYIFSVVMDDVDKLVSDLSSIKIMRFYLCVMPKNIRIASQTLLELRLHDCYGLVDIAIDAPKLETLLYYGGLQLCSLISTNSKCSAHLHLKLNDLDAQTFYRIKNLLNKSKCCKVLSITGHGGAAEIEFDRDQLCEIHDGSPCDIQELKLSLPSSIIAESSLSALVDSLFWSCRPDMLSLSMTLAPDNYNNSTTIKSLVGILQKKVECWKHPLKRIKYEGANCPNLLRSWHLDLPLRLYW